MSDGPDDVEEPEVIEESASFELVLTDDGYEVRDRRRSPTAVMAVFAPDEEGFDAAFEYFGRVDRRERFRGVRTIATKASFWACIAFGLLWAVATAVAQIRLVVMTDPFESEEAYLWVQRVAGLAEIAYAPFLVAFATHVMLRLGSRR